MAKPEPGKILRIGIIQSGKIIEERLLRNRHPITIGQSPKNTFVIPVSNLPKTATLFDLKRGGYVLQFKDGMDGRVSLEDGVMDFGALKSKGVAKRRGDLWNLGLSEKSRGKIVLGDVTLLFQFVTPPPPAPKLQLPAAARGGWVKAIEWHFVIIVLISCFIQAGAIMALVMQDWPEVSRGGAGIPDRFVSLLVPEVQVEAQPEEAVAETGDSGDEVEEVKEEKPKKADKEPKAEKASPGKADPEAAARAAARRKAELAKKVQNNTLLKFIGAKGAGGSGGSVADALSGGASRSRIDDAFAGASGVASAVAGQDRGRVGVGAAGDTGGEAVSIGDLKSSRTGKTVKGGGKKREVKVKAKVKTAGPTSAIGTGKLDKGKIASVVRRRIKSVQSCYERELKKNPDLAGKISMQFTIGSVGRVTAIKATVNTTGSASVANCIKQRISLWRFPKPEGGDVTVSYPFVFTATK